MDSARVTKHDVTSMFPDFNFISQGYEYGDDLVVEADLSVKLNAEMEIMSEFPQAYLTNTTSLVPQNSSFPYVQLCRIRIPGEMWQVVWKP